MLAIIWVIAVPSVADLSKNYKVVTIEINHSESLRGYLYKPADKKAEETFGILYLHGGPELAKPDAKNPIKEYLLERGFTILDIDYRNAYPFPDHKYPLLNYNCHLVADADIEDSIVAINYLRKFTGKVRVGVVGHSNGGEIATRLAFLFPTESAAIVNLEGFSGDWNYKVPENCKWDREKRYPYNYMNADTIKQATPMLSYYGTNEGSDPGFALPAGRGRLDHEDSDMIHGYQRVKRAEESGVSSTPFSYFSMPSICSNHIYLEYLDGHFPHQSETLKDLLPRINSFFGKHLKY